MGSNLFVIFCFSSRRRHTRWNCDWSSDVCSSDLSEGVNDPKDYSGLDLRGYDTDPRFIGKTHAAVPVKEKCFARLDSQATGTGTGHRLDSTRTHDRHIKTQVLAGFTHLDNDRPVAGDSTAARDGPVGAFHGFDGDNRLFLNDNRLPHIHATHRLGDVPAEFDVV